MNENILAPPNFGARSNRTTKKRSAITIHAGRDPETAASTVPHRQIE